MPRALPNLPRMLAAIALAVHALHFTVASAPIYVVVSAQSPLQSVNQNEPGGHLYRQDPRLP